MEDTMDFASIGQEVLSCGTHLAPRENFIMVFVKVGNMAGMDNHFDIVVCEIRMDIFAQVVRVSANLNEDHTTRRRASS